MIRLIISLSITQQYGFKKIMDFIKTDQFYSLQFLAALLKPNIQVKLQPLQPFLKHKRGRINALSRPITHITKRTKPYVPEQFPSQESHQLR